MNTQLPSRRSGGFAFLPVVVLVALVGLMIPTVKYVTDPNLSFDNRGFARIAEKAGFDDQTVEKIRDQVTGGSKGQKKEEVEKDFAQVLKERREERRANPEDGEANNTSTTTSTSPVSEELVGMLDQQAQDSIKNELNPTPTPKATPKTEAVDTGGVVAEAKKAEAEAAAAAAQAATNRLNQSGYLSEDDRVQIEEENRDRVAEAAAQRWAGYAQNQAVDQKPTSRYTTTQSPDNNPTAQAEIAAAVAQQRLLAEQKAAEEARNTQLAANTFLDGVSNWWNNNVSGSLDISGDLGVSYQGTGLAGNGSIPLPESAVSSEQGFEDWQHAVAGGAVTAGVVGGGGLWRGSFRICKVNDVGKYC